MIAGQSQRGGGRAGRCRSLAYLAALCAAGSLTGRAQETPAAAPQAMAAAPQANAAAPQGQTGLQPVATATVRGMVTDGTGGIVPGASVALLPQEDTTGAAPVPMQTTTTGSDGHFELRGVPTGTYRVRVLAEDLLPGTVPVTVLQGHDLTLPTITLRPGGTDFEVDVTATRQEVAEAEMKAEETQRLVGFIPNFYVTYDWHAAPLSPRQKAHLAAHTIADPANLVLTAGFAGVEQAANEFSGYGQGAAGYGKRLGAGLADLTTGTLLGGALLPILFRQDPRYFYKGTGSIRSRFFYALSTAVIARGDNGKWQFSYAGVLGDLGSGAISNAYYPASDRHGVRLTFENGLISIATDGAQNVVQEFLLRRLTPHAPSYATEVATPR